MNKIPIAIELVEAFLGFRKMVNSLDLEQIEWTYRGRPIPIDPKLIEQFKLTGLSNVAFIATDYYDMGTDG